MRPADGAGGCRRGRSARGLFGGGCGLVGKGWDGLGGRLVSGCGDGGRGRVRLLPLCLEVGSRRPLRWRAKGSLPGMHSGERARAGGVCPVAGLGLVDCRRAQLAVGSGAGTGWRIRSPQLLLAGCGGVADCGGAEEAGASGSGLAVVRRGGLSLVFVSAGSGLGWAVGFGAWGWAEGIRLPEFRWWGAVVLRVAAGRLLACAASSAFGGVSSWAATTLGGGRRREMLSGGLGMWLRGRVRG